MEGRPLCINATRCHNHVYPRDECNIHLFRGRLLAIPSLVMHIAASLMSVVACSGIPRGSVSAPGIFSHLCLGTAGFQLGEGGGGIEPPKTGGPDWAQ